MPQSKLQSKSPPSSSAITESLRSHMQTLGISSFRALAEHAGITRWQLRQFRAGNTARMRLEVLQNLSDALQIQLAELLAIVAPVPAPSEPDSSEPTPSEPDSSEVNSFDTSSSAPPPPASLAALQQEYNLLQKQLEQQRSSLQQEFQRHGLYRLETWMKNWPKVVHVVQTRNPELPAAKVLALVSPVQQLLKDWGLETVGEIGAKLAYNPTLHHLSGVASPGDLVEVTQPGYLHHGAVLHRAEVRA